MSEYILPEVAAKKMRLDCGENKMQIKKQSAKHTIILKDEHILMIDEIMLSCIAELHGPKKG